MTNPEIDAIHRELADRLVQVAGEDEVAFYDTLGEVVERASGPR